MIITKQNEKNEIKIEVNATLTQQMKINKGCRQGRFFPPILLNTHTHTHTHIYIYIRPSVYSPLKRIQAATTHVKCLEP